MFAREQFVQQDTEREDVRALIDRLVAQLFGRHVGERAGHLSGQTHGRHHCGRGIGGCRRRQALRDPEVHDLDVALGAHHHVCGLQVPVHDAPRVCELERIRHFDRDPHRFFLRHAASGEPFLETRSLHVLHREEGTSLVLTDFVDLTDEGMVEVRRGARLPDEALVGVVQGRQKKLQGDLAVK